VAASVIDKLAWLHVVDRRLLVVRSRGRRACYLPGGKREPGESDAQALQREIREELTVELQEGTLQQVGVFRAQADGQPDGVEVVLTCYRAEYRGRLAPAAEIESVLWLRHGDRGLCSPAGQRVLDWAKQRDLID
jgi:8-oxo-dGTP diphosphatase